MPSDWDAYSYAKFLVDVFPEDAVDILRMKGTREITKLVEEHVDNACIKLGTGSRNEIKGMVEKRQWTELKDLKLGSSSTPSATTHNYQPTGSVPPTPSSSASGSLHPRRASNQDWISVYHMGDQFQLSAKSSGSGDFFIGEDKVERIQGVTNIWIDAPKKVDLGGQLLDVAQYVDLTWNHGEGGSHFNRFWVVREGTIRHADVLLGYPKQQHRDRGDKDATHSPLSLGLQRVPPPAPTPPSQVLHQVRKSSSSAIYSIPGNTVHEPGRGRSHHDMATAIHQPIQSHMEPGTVMSGPPSFRGQLSHASSSIDRPPSRAGSASSNKTARSSRSDTVLVQLSFEGASKKLIPIDLTKSADEVIPYLEAYISRTGKQLDPSIHEIDIVSLKENAPEPESSSLSDLDYSWDAMIAFMLENRVGGANKKAEFRFVIYRPSGS